MSPHVAAFQYLVHDENANNPLLTTIQNHISLLHTTNFSPYPSSLSNNSTSDEAEEPQIDILSERKRRRMISNRESARRSRMRKQKQLDELLMQLVYLRTDYQSLVEKMNSLTESHERAVEENARLKEERTDICRMLDDIQLENTSSFLQWSSS